MSDPAVEAADRAWANRYRNLGPESRAASAAHDGLGGFILDAAREALRPLRGVHRPAVVDDDDHRVCAKCWGPNGPADWPCVTAELIYSSEEFANV